MTARFPHVRGASLPAESLAALADLRREAAIFVLVEGDRAWVRWEGEDDGVALRLLAIADVTLFDRRDDHWYLLGRRLPEFATPLDSPDRVPLHRALVPSPVAPKMPDPFGVSASPLRLVRDTRPRAATALRCRLQDLARWAEMATSFRLASLTAAVAGEDVRIRGENLPFLVHSGRFWGDRLLIPLGFRADPQLPEAALLSALGVSREELGFLGEDGCEVVPLEAFRPMTRAAVRLAALEASP